MANARLCCGPSVSQDRKLLYTIRTGSLYADAAGFSEHVGPIGLPSTFIPFTVLYPLHLNPDADLCVLCRIFKRMFVPIDPTLRPVPRYRRFYDSGGNFQAVLHAGARKIHDRRTER